jgi:glycosyltransferase involved in cell wall biosynthesis
MSAPENDLALSVVVLAYNEVDNLPQAVSELLDELSQRAEDWELIIVDDGSSDGTGECAERLAEGRPRVRVVHHGKNLGLGGGYRTGFREARGTWLTFFPADGQFPAEIISTFYKHTPNVDMILGFLPNRDVDRVGKALSLIERILYKLMFQSFPRFQGIMMFKRAMLAQIPLVSEGRGWAVVM